MSDIFQIIRGYEAVKQENLRLLEQATALGIIEEVDFINDKIQKAARAFSDALGKATSSLMQNKDYQIRETLKSEGLTSYDQLLTKILEHRPNLSLLNFKNYNIRQNFIKHIEIFIANYSAEELYSIIKAIADDKYRWSNDQVIRLFDITEDILKIINTEAIKEFLAVMIEVSLVKPVNLEGSLYFSKVLVDFMCSFQSRLLREETAHLYLMVAEEVYTKDKEAGDDLLGDILKYIDAEAAANFMLDKSYLYRQILLANYDEFVTAQTATKYLGALSSDITRANKPEILSKILSFISAEEVLSLSDEYFYQRFLLSNINLLLNENTAEKFFSKALSMPYLSDDLLDRFLPYITPQELFVRLKDKLGQYQFEKFAIRNIDLLISEHNVDFFLTRASECCPSDNDLHKIVKALLRFKSAEELYEHFKNDKIILFKLSDLLINQDTAKYYLANLLEMYDEEKEEKTLNNLVKILSPEEILEQLDHKHFLYNRLLFAHSEILLNKNTLNEYVHLLIQDFGFANRDQCIISALKFVTKEQLIQKFIDINSNNKSEGKFYSPDLIASVLMGHVDLLMTDATIPLFKQAITQGYIYPSYVIEKIEKLRSVIIDESNINDYLMILARALNSQLNEKAYQDKRDDVIPINIQTISDQIIFLKEAITGLIKSGADIYYQQQRSMTTFTFMNIGTNNEFVEFAKSLGAKCGADHWRATWLMEQHNMVPYSADSDLFKNSLKAVNTPGDDTNKIPCELNHIWFTHPGSPREMPYNEISVLIENKNLFKHDICPWVHILWVNDESLIPQTAYLLKINGFEVRSIYSNKDYPVLSSNLYDAISKKEWGIASDLWRYMIVEEKGGAYGDVNFAFFQPIGFMHHQFDFFAKDFINYFFAAKAHHPILQSILRIAEDMINNNYVQISSFATQDTFLATAYKTLVPFAMGILQSANQEGNNDAVISEAATSQDESQNTNNDFVPPCPYSLWTLLAFNYHPDFCVSPKYVIGVDGAGDSHLNWIE